MSSFYIGYLPQAPADLRRFLRRTVAVLMTVGATVAVTLVLAQQKFSPAVFEYTTIRYFEGTLRTNPYPALHVAKPGSEEASSYLLVGVGKHGFDERLRELDGKSVRLRAKRIYRDEGTMLEVVPGSIAPAEASAAPEQQLVSMGMVTLTGEIVDSKCFLGVMNPGRSKVHRDCATRCISGGAPPLLLVDRVDQQGLYLLTKSDGAGIGVSEILSYVGERIQVTGELLRAGTTQTISYSRIVRAD